MSAPLDLGLGHTARFTSWNPDRELNPQYEGIPDQDPCGLIIDHPDARDPSKQCSGAVLFDLPGMAAVFKDRELWQVASLDPITITPSVLCTACGDHGFVTAGRWVAA